MMLFSDVLVRYASPSGPVCLRCLMLTLSVPMEFLLCLIATWTCVVVSNMLAVCSLCVFLSMCLFVLCVLCFIFECYCVVFGLCCFLLANPCMVFQRVCVLCL